MSARVTGFDRLFKKMNKALSGVGISDTLYNKMGAYVRSRIYAKTKSGISMVTGFKFKELSEVTIKLRKWHRSKAKPTGPGFVPSKSNLTYTGQMLEALKYKVDQKSKLVRIFIENSTRTYEGSGPRGRKTGKSKTNKEVAKDVMKNGRPFIGLDELGRKAIIEIAKKEIRNEIRKNRLRK